MTGDEASARASILLDLGRADEALRLVAPLLASGEHPAPHELAVALLALGRNDDAARAAQAGLESFGPVPELARVAAYAFRAAGAAEQALAVARAAEATAALATVLSLAPNSPDVRLVAALRGLGLLDERRNRVGKAARWYAQALRLRPGDEELAGRVRALFGRLIGSVAVAFVVANFVIFIAFMARADPAPGQQNPGGLPDAVLWALWIAGFAGFFAVTIWSSVRGVPRVVLDALVSETRTYRRVRLCTRLTLAYAVSVVLTILAALAPIGNAADRLGVVVLLWLASMILMAITCVALRLTFGFGQTRPATAHPRDRSFTG